MRQERRTVYHQEELNALINYLERDRGVKSSMLSIDSMRRELENRGQLEVIWMESDGASDRRQGGYLSPNGMDRMNSSGRFYDENVMRINDSDRHFMKDSIEIQKKVGGEEKIKNKKEQVTFNQKLLLL